MALTDTTNTGKLLINLNASYSVVTGTTMHSDGKVTFAGYANIENKGYVPVTQINPDGTLNKQFGNQGVLLLQEGLYREVRVVQATGGGFFVVGTAFAGADYQVALIRVTANGVLDTSFSGDGKAYFSSHRLIVKDVAQQSDGKLIVVGSDVIDNSGTVYTAYRVNSDGSLDSSFGTGGKVVLDLSDLFLGSKLSDGADILKQVLVQPDGKILLSGQSAPAYNGSERLDVSIVRLNTDGSLDNTFGKGGRLLVDVNGFDHFTGLSILGNGKLMLASTTYDYDKAAMNPMFTRLNADGSYDATYGVQGKVSVAFPLGANGQTQFAIQRDGKMVFTFWEGSTSNGFQPGIPHFGVIRLNTDGTWDTTFGNGGKVIVGIGDSDELWTVNIQDDGKIVLGGGSSFSSVGSTFFSAVRLNTDGSLDTTFNKVRPVGLNVLGTGGAESVSATLGDDVIDGGDGVDTVIYGDALSKYTIRKSAEGVSVSEKSGSISYDSLVRVERLQFSDVTVDLTSKANAATISKADLNSLTELYIAFFNRAPDAEGLGFWINAFRNGETLNQIADSFYAAAVQFASLTGYSQNMDAESFVSLVYKNVLGRTSVDPEGLKYWSSSLVDGTESKGSLVKSILNSAHTFKGDATWGWVANLLDNKIVAGQKVAVDMGLTYNSPEQSIAKGMAIAGAVSADSIENAISLIGVSPVEYVLG